MLDNIEEQKRRRRKNLASLPFDVKIAMLIHMQTIAREMAQSAGREFKGVVWCEEDSPRSCQDLSR